MIERHKKLPPSRVAEGVDFVEFLSQCEARAAAAQRLTDGLARLDALNLPLVSEDEVEAEIQASQADLIASGDKRDLLPLGSYQGIPIVTARAAVERLEARSKT